MLTLRKTHSTFVALNQCGVILPDTSTLILVLFKDIRSIRHLRTIGKSIIGLGIRQRHSLNCSKDDGFSLFNPTLTSTRIRSVLWASPLKIVPFPDEGRLLSLLVKGIFSTRGGATSSSLSTDRKQMTDGRLNEFFSKNLLILNKWGIFRGKLLSPSLNFIPSGSR